MAQIFGPDGVIARHHPNYEYREGQVRMAEAVLQAITEGGHLCVEAGTGTGKTLAYLVPALLAHERVIISTGTKNLQEQLYTKDVPFLERALGRKLRVAYMKGRANYLCLYRLKKSEFTPFLEAFDDIDHFDTVRQWAHRTEVGDRAELTELPEHLSFWSSIDARSDTCLGQKCPDYDACFITQMRQRALEADIVIVNHHLFFADLAIRGHEYGTVIPDYSMVIFDEAHELEDIASEYFGAQVSNYKISELIRDTEMAPTGDTIVSGEIHKICAGLKQRSARFWNSFQTLPEGHPQKYGDSRGLEADGRFVLTPSIIFKAGKRPPAAQQSITGPADEDPHPKSLTQVGTALMGLLNSLTRLETSLASIKEAPAEISSLARRAGQVRRDLDFVMACAETQFVYWCERRNRGTFLQATPIDISEILAEQVFDRLPTVILTSATLTSNHSFGYIRARLGIGQARELIVPSHFDFTRQAILYLPPRMADPRDPNFVNQAVDEIIKILRMTTGRAFVLFTSILQMNAVYKRVSEQVEYPCFIQGQGSKGGLLEKFRNTPQAVLFATSSFWQGVDVQGEALSCVIIDRLPFAVPTDPVVAARQRYIEERGGEPFFDYSVPQAVLMLKQGLGRLIRSSEDVGVLSVLDPRLRTKAYGQVFLRSLPPCPVTTEIKDIARVFSKRSR